LLLALNIPFSSALFAIALLIISESVIAKLIADIVSVALTYALSKRLIFKENEKYENNRW